MAEMPCGVKGIGQMVAGQIPKQKGRLLSETANLIQLEKS
ncbi:hypothetical protein L53_15220 [Hyphomonas sp. L-53-1-40]|nr:hypothetical protein L53_15220 [Hyphomonas sp. L-53-1-40]